MNGVQVTPEYVSTAAANCDDTAGSIDRAMASLRSFVTDLETRWHGIASTTFNGLMTDYDIYGRMLHNALVDIGSGLRGNAVNYVDSETANINSLVKVNGSIPGAKL